MTKMFVGGEWVGARSEEMIPVISPVDGARFAEIPRGAEADVDRAVQAAQRALDGVWGRTSAMERGRILMRLSQKILDASAELAQLEARDTGKPMTTARNDIEILARYFEFYGGGADKVHGQIIPFLDGYTVWLLREPLGVTGHVIPGTIRRR